MTDAERLDELRELVNGERPALSFPAIDGLRLVLAELDAVIKRRDEAFAQVAGLRMELDAANKTIAYAEQSVQANLAQIVILQQQVWELTEERDALKLSEAMRIPKRAEARRVEQERDDYKAALEFYASEKTYKLGVQISMGSAHPLHEPIRYDKGEQARQTLAKYAPRQEDAKTGIVQCNETERMIDEMSSLDEPINIRVSAVHADGGRHLSWQVSVGDVMPPWEADTLYEAVKQAYEGYKAMKEDAK